MNARGKYPLLCLMVGPEQILAEGLMSKVTRITALQKMSLWLWRWCAVIVLSSRFWNRRPVLLADRVRAFYTPVGVKHNKLCERKQPEINWYKTNFPKEKPSTYYTAISTQNARAKLCSLWVELAVYLPDWKLASWSLVSIHLVLIWEYGIPLYFKFYL